MQPMALNYWAVLVAGIAFWILGAIWYARPAFGNSWMRLIGKTEEQIKAEYSPMKLVWALLASLVQAYGIARMMSYTMAGSWGDGLLVGVLLGTCLILPAMGISDIMEGRPAKLTWINVLYVIVGYVIIGLILGFWR
jgi:hypothetical protein